ncbi:hypothetical protein [Aggregatibacter actinomycetemcomitans]|uniref:hypothetical protein n=1 Tax=Aggregatibacter actinomycetemcomitans TaxID=714 RepID=UPI00197B3E9C|nr:hypothetical protein [Aggregatibacter actinomycetemcomitans]MBN6060444.1 hypothetical protein [Aggregatibacter actinomycetemcomitans]MBN6088996.1 hypothetical protein [Aggregatibacter actinomycetemcomitans]
MKKLLIKCCTWYLAREYRNRTPKTFGNQAIKNNGRNRDVRDLAQEFDIPLAVAARFVK